VFLELLHSIVSAPMKSLQDIYLQLQREREEPCKSVATYAKILSNQPSLCLSTRRGYSYNLADFVSNHQELRILAAQIFL